MESIWSGATERLPVSIRATNRGRAIDPTSDVVQFAFMVGDAQPGTSDWHNGSWDSVAIAGTPVYLAFILIGPAGFVLPVGVWQVWARVIHDPEIPGEPVGLLEIY